MFDEDDAALLVFFYVMHLCFQSGCIRSAYRCWCWWWYKLLCLYLCLVPYILPPKIQLYTHFWWWSLSMLIYALALCPLPVKTWETHLPFGSSCIHIDPYLSVLDIYSPVLRLVTCTGLYLTLHHSVLMWCVTCDGLFLCWMYALAPYPLPVKSWVTHLPFGSSCIQSTYTLLVVCLYLYFLPLFYFEPFWI